MKVPSVLCLSGLDPSGGAGLQADIEACAANGVHVLGLVTTLTVQDTNNAKEIQPISGHFLRKQMEFLLADCTPAAVKIGLIGDIEQIEVISELLPPLGVPVVCDPILCAGGGWPFLTEAAQHTLLAKLLPCVTVLTPNASEVRRLAPEAGDLAVAASALLGKGCAHVLVTGGDEPGSEVINTWYRMGYAPLPWRWPRLPGPFHGAGCTLAASLAARLARQEPMETALDEAQRYTHITLGHPLVVGGGRPIPGRF